MWPDLIVVSTPILHFLPCVVKAQEPVRVQAFASELAVEGFDEAVVGRLAWPGEVQRDIALVGPQVEIARHKLGALIDTDRRRESHFIANPFQYLHDIDAAKGESWLQRRREAGERIDNCEHAKLAPGCQLVMNKVHGPCLVRPRGLLAVIAQFGLDPAPWRFVAQLQAQFLVKPIDAFGIDRQTIPPQQDVNAAITVAPPCLADTFDPVLEIRLVATLRPVNTMRDRFEGSNRPA